jgi:hypothetical protein
LASKRGVKPPGETLGVITSILRAVLQALLADESVDLEDHFYRERVLANPDDPDDLRNELVEIPVTGIMPDSRVYWLVSLHNKKEDREARITAKFFVDRHGRITLEFSRIHNLVLRTEAELTEMQETGEPIAPWVSIALSAINTAISIASKLG